MNPHICHRRKLVFVHNPKAAGSSFRKWLGFEGRYDHLYPSINVPLDIWNTYSIIVVVRDPIERLLSSYRFHTDKSYKGALLNNFPDIHSFDIVKYIRNLMKVNSTYIAPQYKFTQHLMSYKEPEFLLHLENLDVTEIAQKYDINDNLPVENKGKNRKYVEIDEELYIDIIKLYKVDYFLFGYRPKPYDQFREEQLNNSSHT